MMEEAYAEPAQVQRVLPMYQGMQRLQMYGEMEAIAGSG